MNMEKLIANFPEQIEEAIEIGENAKIDTQHKYQIQNILVTGLGGSGMGAEIVNDLTAHELPLPFGVNKNYHLPAYVGKHTLLIASSYSGNTEETLTALNQALHQKANITCITSGGKMLEIAQKNNLNYIQLPNGMPPRACMGYSFVQQLYILKNYQFLTTNFTKQLQQTVQFLKQQNAYIKEQADQLAEKIHPLLPIIYAPDGYTSAAVRWRQQINENAKMLCWHHTIPEMNHNELVGWKTPNPEQCVLFLTAPNIFNRTAYRIQINQQIIQQYCPNIFTINAQGTTKTEQIMYLTYFGDWLSWYLSTYRKVDAMEVKVIDFLKNELGKI